MEDFVTWVDTSKLKRTIMTYNDEVRFLALLYSCCQYGADTYSPSSMISIYYSQYIAAYSVALLVFAPTLMS